MKSYKIEGIVIKRYNIGEADKILTVFSKHHGKIQIKAAGIRRISSKRSAHVELFNHAFLTLYSGKSLPMLTEAITCETFSQVKADLRLIGYAYHISELVDKLCPENQAQRDVFDLLHGMLTRLPNEKHIGASIIEFESKLLQLLGFLSEARPAYANISVMIEDILERKLKTRPLLSHFSS